MSWQLPSDYQQQYLKACQYAVTDEGFKTFRRDPVISTVIENSSRDQMNLDLLTMKSDYQWLITKLGNFATSDAIGSPVIYNRYGVTLSPTTTRYVVTAGLIGSLFGNLDNQKITEIGAGYGGQCKIIHDIWQVSEYTIYDLPEPFQLQKKFLACFDIKVTQGASFQASDLLIAWCSWSELDRDERIGYLELIKLSKHYFIYCNYDRDEDKELLGSIGDVNELKGQERVFYR